MRVSASGNSSSNLLSRCDLFHWRNSVGIAPIITASSAPTAIEPVQYLPISPPSKPKVADASTTTPTVVLTPDCATRWSMGGVITEREASSRLSTGTLLKRATSCCTPT